MMFLMEDGTAPSPAKRASVPMVPRKPERAPSAAAPLERRLPQAEPPRAPSGLEEMRLSGDCTAGGKVGF
jgi:hypothetical protein